MEWDRIRAHYAALLAAKRAAGLTQQDIARAGKVGAQNAISKLVSNQNLGPTVGVFVKAVHGLGKTVSEFFAEIERDEPAPEPPLVDPPAATRFLHDRVADLERTLAAQHAAAASPSSTSPSGSAIPPGPTGRSPHGVYPSTGIVNHISTISSRELLDFQTEVRASTATIADRLDRLERSLVETRGTHRSDRPKTTRARKHPRRRARKHA